VTDRARNIDRLGQGGRPAPAAGGERAGGGLVRADWVLSETRQPDAAEEYRASVASLFDIRFDADQRSGFHNHVESYNFGVAMFGRCRSTPQTLLRSDAAARRYGFDHIQLVAHLTGAYSSDYDGRSAQSEPGSVHLVDMSRPLRSKTTAFDTLNLIIPREALGAAWADRDLHGLSLGADRLSVGLLTAHLKTLWSGLHDLSLAEASAGVSAACALVVGAIRGQAQFDPSHRKPMARTLRSLTRSYVDARLGDRDLTPDAIALHLGVSRRTLYRIFEETGGVAAYIQSRRLDGAFAVLVGPEGERRSLAEVAYAHGFQSDAHFSRAFRTRFGMPPGEIRGLNRLSEAAGEPDRDGIGAILAGLREL